MKQLIRTIKYADCRVSVIVNPTTRNPTLSTIEFTIEAYKATEKNLRFLINSGYFDTNEIKYQFVNLEYLRVYSTKRSMSEQTFIDNSKEIYSEKLMKKGE